MWLGDGMKQGPAVAFSCDLETPVMRSWAQHGEWAARGTLPGLHRKAANWDSDLLRPQLPSVKNGEFVARIGLSDGHEAYL